jgi:hypothetical protein
MFAVIIHTEYYYHSPESKIDETMNKTNVDNNVPDIQYSRDFKIQSKLNLLPRAFSMQATSLYFH